jgi:hypothetical protein
MSHSPTVKTATSADIAEALLRSEKSSKPGPLDCPTCKKSFIQVRAWQKFCSAKCRQAAVRSMYAERAGELHAAVRDVVAENKALREENERLRCELSQYQK